MKKNRSFMFFLIFFGCAMLVAIGTVHLERFTEGPLRYSGFVFIALCILVLIIIYNRKIVFTDNEIEIKSLIGRKTTIPYERVKSVEYIETKSSSGNGITTKVRNIRFNIEDGTSIQFAETQIKYKRCVMQLLEAYDNAKLPGRAIKPATRDRLLNSINQKENN